MAEVMTINQQVQLGVETTSGQAPAGGSNKLLTGLKLQIDPDFTSAQYAGQGRRFDSLSVPSQEKSKLSGSGPLTYTESVYPQSGVYGDATMSVPAGAVNAHQWLYAPSLSGVIAGKTYQVQQGDAVQARQVNYGQFTDWGFAASRKDTQVSVAGFAQRVQDGITRTASPTTVGLIPVEPIDWNVYLDTTSANVGTTKLLRCFAANFGYTGAYGDAWPMDRSQSSFATVANLKPSLAVSLMLMADSTLSTLWTEARAAGKVYIRYEAISAILIDNYQTLTITGTPTGGTFTLSYKGQTTAAIAYNALAGDVQTALEALTTIGTGNVTCSGGPLPGSAVTITFTGILANDATLLTHTDSLTGGVSPVAALAQTTIPYSYTHDVCCVPAPDKYQDTEGLWTQSWNFHVVEDATWTAGSASGTAIVTKVVNNLSAL